MRARILALMVGVALLASVPPLAQAQMFNSIGGGARPQDPAPKVAPPPALPGAESKKGDAAPASRSSLDMEPTDALFDAINRGDIAAARESISRGADLRGRNVLGMSPLELSVDLGRNDISFMLLSMRAADDGSNRASAPLAGSPKSTPKRPEKPVATSRSPAAAKSVT